MAEGGKRAILAGILGMVSALLVLGLVGLSQSTPTFAPAALNSNFASSSVASQGENNHSITSSQTVSPNLPEGARLNPESSQSIQSPMAFIGIIVLGGISLVVGAAAAFLISRKNP
jgi:hypothetical protein